jgi:hypothetical protein
MFGRKKKAEIEAAKAEVLASIMAWRAAVGDLDRKTVGDDGKTIGYGAGSMPAAVFFEALIKNASAAFGGLSEEDLEGARRKASLEVQAEEAHEDTPEETAASDEEMRQTIQRLNEAERLRDRPEVAHADAPESPISRPTGLDRKITDILPRYKQRLPLILPSPERLSAHKRDHDPLAKEQFMERLRQRKIARGEDVTDDGRDYMAEVEAEGKGESEGKDEA